MARRASNSPEPVKQATETGIETVPHIEQHSISISMLPRCKAQSNLVLLNVPSLRDADICTIP